MLTVGNQFACVKGYPAAGPKLETCHVLQVGDVQRVLDEPTPLTLNSLCLSDSATKINKSSTKHGFLRRALECASQVVRD